MSGALTRFIPEFIQVESDLLERCNLYMTSMKHPMRVIFEAEYTSFGWHKYESQIFKEGLGSIPYACWYWAKTRKTRTFSYKEGSIYYCSPLFVTQLASQLVLVTSTPGALFWLCTRPIRKRKSYLDCSYFVKLKQTDGASCTMALSSNRLSFIIYSIHDLRCYLEWCYWWHTSG